ncbi:MAG: hypothetical protein C5B54_05750 [Acidobacteria bacterium]|nr:MAG: hypothetical protein C5B54_05750 [Acidobacteriota bacterium]
MEGQVPMSTTATRVWSEKQQRIFGWFAAFTTAVKPRHLVVRARAGCLAADTMISVNRAGRGWSLRIDELAAKFNNQPWSVQRSDGVVTTARPWNPAIPTFIQQEHNGVIRLGQIQDIWCSGTKQTGILQLTNGKEIRATAEHPFLTENGWESLGSLKPGSFVHVRSSQRLHGPAPKKTYPRLSGLWNHPFAMRSQPDATHRYGSAKVPLHRLVIEAAHNGLELNEFLNRVFAGALENLWFLDPEELTVHHRDHNPQNNALGNLDVLPIAQHHQLHAREGTDENVLFKVDHVKVASIVEAEPELTYDIEVTDEPHNFVANGFVVHNTGKTTTIIEALRHLPKGIAVLLCAFNKEIQQELVRKLAASRDIHITLLPTDRQYDKRLQQAVRTATGVTIQTLHAAGLAAIAPMWPRLTVCNDDTRERDLARRVCPKDTPESVQKLVAKLCTKGREQAPHATQPEDLYKLALKFECEPYAATKAEGYDLNFILSHALKAMILAAAQAPTTGIDFADMIFLPLRKGWLRPRYDLVVVDECLPGYTPVLLADGTSRSIKDIVESPNECFVRAFDTTTQSTKICKVIGKQRILNQKPLVKIKAQTAVKDKGHHFKTRFVICTIDHKIWTQNRGWVKAGQINLGDQVIWETSAETTLQGMIGGKGRQHLSTIHLSNQKGLGNRGGSFTIRGGNSTGPTTAEQTLANALGEEWVLNYIFNTRQNQLSGQGWPSHYKLDMAHPDKKIAVEVDGTSHQSPIARTRDRKKATYLKAFGWTVFRVSNQRAIHNTLEEVHRITGHSPLPATVVSVEPTTIKDPYVYDLTVEDCHNFYANGILVHNCQDMTISQLEIAQGLCKGSIVVVGDDKQAIYDFRGADSHSLDRLKQELQAEELPLNVTYRCGKAIVAEAQRYVPDFEAHDHNPEGAITTLPVHHLVEAAEHGDFILSRANAPLMSLAMSLLHHRKRARIRGRDIGRGLISLIQKLKAYSLPDLATKLAAWKDREISRLENRYEGLTDTPAFKGRVEGIRDQAAMLTSLTENAEDIPSITAMIQYIEALFTDDGQGAAGVITLSSVHKAKGLEAPRVFALRDTFRTHTQEEVNITYVAITRAIHTLTWVHGRDGRSEAAGK